MRADKVARAAAEGAASAVAWRERLTGERPLLPAKPVSDKAQDKTAKAKTGRAKARDKRKDKAAKRNADRRDHRRGPMRVQAAQAYAAPVSAAGWFVLAAVILGVPRGKPLTRHITDGLDALRRDAADAISGLDAPREPHELDQAQPGRGRGATSPAKIPPRGWRDILGRAWQDFNNDQITSVAAGVTYFTLLAIFPAMAAFVSLYGLFADPSSINGQLQVVSGVLPHDALNFIGDQLKRMTQHKAQLGFGFVLSLLISLWSANGAVKALFHGLNVSYQERERRGFVRLNLVSLAFTLGGIVFMMLAAGAVVVVPPALKLLGLDGPGGGWLGPLVGLLRWPLLLLFAAGALSVVYRFGPSRSHARWRWITAGAMAAAVLWLAASMLFSWYVGHFGSYNKTYGSLGAVVGFMTWMWISAIVVLFGAEVNSEIEHQTGVDSTTGAPKPMGSRGAKMADTLGASPPVKAGG